MLFITIKKKEKNMELIEEPGDYYKVVSYNPLISKHFLSAITPIKRDGVIYPLNKWTRANEEAVKHGYHLLVFDSLENAVDFKKCRILNMGLKLYIFKCKISKKMKIGNRLDMNGKGINWDKRYYRFFRFPQGTIMAKCVKIYGEPL
jgi:hypothetical protein